MFDRWARFILGYYYQCRHLQIQWVMYQEPSVSTPTNPTGNVSGSRFRSCLPIGQPPSTPEANLNINSSSESWLCRSVKLVIAKLIEPGNVLVFSITFVCHQSFIHYLKKHFKTVHVIIQTDLCRHFTTFTIHNYLNKIVIYLMSFGYAYLSEIRIIYYIFGRKKWTHRVELFWSWNFSWEHRALSSRRRIKNYFIDQLLTSSTSHYSMKYKCLSKPWPIKMMDILPYLDNQLLMIFHKNFMKNRCWTCVHL